MLVSLESMFIYCICTQYLVGAPFALITALIRRGMEVISLWHCWGGMEAQVSLDRGLQLIYIFWSLVSSFSYWQYPIDSSMGFRSGEFAGSQAHQLRGHLTNFWCFWQCGQEPKSCLENEISIFKKLVSRRKHEVLQNSLVKGAVMLVFKKYNGPTPADDIAPQIITDCGNLTLDFKQLGLWVLHPFLQTLGLGFQMKYKTCSHLKRGLWITGQQSSSLLLSPVRRLWRQL